MSLPGETIANGAAPRCEDCDKMPHLDVDESGAGFYIGTYYHCGPYTRESGYLLPHSRSGTGHPQRLREHGEAGDRVVPSTSPTT